MKHCLLPFFLLILHLHSFSQNGHSEFIPPPMNYGKNIREQLTQTTFDIAEKEDDAIILFNKGKFGFTYRDGLLFEETYHVRKKILSENGRREGNIQLHFSHNYSNNVNYSYSSQKIDQIQATAYNLENGEIKTTEIKKDDIFERKLDPHYTEVSFAIPDVKVGTIIEYSYRKISEGLILAPTWYFTSDLPVLYSQLTFEIPNNLRYSSLLRGSHQIDYHTSEKSGINFGGAYEKWPSMLHKWGMANLRPLLAENHVANVNDFKNQIQFRLNELKFPGRQKEVFNTTWEKLNENLIENDYAEQLKPRNKIRKLVEELIAGKPDKSDQVKALYEYIRANFEVTQPGWVYTSKPVKQVLKEQSGKFADINLLFINMLKTANFDAKPFLISTRDDGYIVKSQPSMKSFTYPVVLLSLNNKEYLLNAVPDNRPFYLARKQDYNMEGWVVDENNYGWKNAEHLAPLSQRQYIINGTLNKQGTFSGKVDVVSSGYMAAADRKEIKEENVEARLSDLYDQSGHKSNLQVQHTTTGNMNDVYHKFRYSGEFSVDNFSPSVNNYLYINPIVFERKTEHSFQQKERTYPVDFEFPFQLLYSISFTVPEGYELEEKEKSFSLKLGEASTFMRSVQKLNNKLIVTLRYEMDETIHLPESYQKFRSYMDQVVAEMNKQIVLKKEL